MGTRVRLRLIFEIDRSKKNLPLADEALLIRAHMVIIQELQRKPGVIY